MYTNGFSNFNYLPKTLWKHKHSLQNWWLLLLIKYPTIFLSRLWDQNGHKTVTQSAVP